MKKKKSALHSKPRKKAISKKRARGAVGAGTMYVLFILLLVSAAGFLFMGGKLPEESGPENGMQVIPITNTPEPSKRNLQLYTFGFTTAAPTQPIVTNCTDNPSDTEREILVGYDPAPGTSAINGGKIRVFVTDEGAPKVAQGTTIDASGTVTNHGDTTARDSGTNGNGNWTWNPAIYIDPPGLANGTFCTSESTCGLPHFPDMIKGDYNPNSGGGRGGGASGPAVDADYKTFENGPDYKGKTPLTLPDKSNSDTAYFAEFIWNTSSLGLTSGNHIAQFVIHDGDTNIGVDCLNIVIP